MPLKNPELTKFTTASDAVVNYSYSDIRDGTGTQVYFGAATTDSVGVNYILNKNAVYSDPPQTASTMTGAAFAKEIDIDFDVSTFKIAQTVEGTAQFSMTWILNQPAAGGTEGYLIFRLKKNDVEIGSVQSETVAQVAGGNVTTSLLDLAVSAAHFEVGDVLRVTVEAWAKRSGGDGQIIILHDPKGRVYSNPDALTITPLPEDTSVFQVNIPYKLDL